MANDPVDERIGHNIRAWRERRGMPQVELGRKLSPAVSGSSIYAYETGRNRISAAMLVQVGSALQCNVAELLNGVPGIFLRRDYSDELKRVLSDEDVQKRIQEFAGALVQGLGLTVRDTERHNRNPLGDFMDGKPL